MIQSLAFILIFGLLASVLFNTIKLPKIIGMLLVGVVLGPCVLNLLDDSILLVSGDIRKIALIIILLKAGLTLDLSDLKKVGRPAVLMSFLPASFEILGYYIFAPMLLGISRTDALVMGAVLAAVSPAVVVPRMVSMIDNKWGTKKAIPQMILAGASCDDIFVIVLFSSFSTMAAGGKVSFLSFANIPISIILGVVVGLVLGILVALVFNACEKAGKAIRGTYKLIAILGLAFLLISLEKWLEGLVAMSGLLAVVALAAALKIKSDQAVIKDLSAKFGKIWFFAEILLFVLVGAAVDIGYVKGAGLKAVGLILLALVVRSFGVVISTFKTSLNFKERLFSVIAYLPKATVQAAIGSVPLAMGLGCGQIVLSVAVMGIIITAPLGAIGIDSTYKKLLEKDN